ncbi:beta-ketoacyl-[acyl-carrier-protein] synthase family protein [Actinopolyspora sp. BKK1]|nr:beta-ketoacyl-[acyl-carrier-protein] synthase family protein [Actinopolyspora sp. BKK2]NHE78446.1 beta-ketoacyl-[acyl-carrier-protein] synthase family protein [Actinopolyspora sp. BKK1]
MSRRVVITGIGVLAPGATSVKAFWEMLREGRTATRRISFFDPSPFRSQVAAEVDFNPELSGLGPQESRRMDRAAQFAVVAARDAVTDSGLEFEETVPERTGVTMGTAVGATMGLDEEYRIVSNGGCTWLVDHEYAVPHLYSYLVPSSFAAEVAWAIGAEGPTSVVSAGCTSGLDAVSHACELIREGSVDTMITGATDAPISPITVACFDAIKATTPRNDDPEHASRPFSASRNGFVLGEGSAVFVLEEYEHAKARNAHIYAEVSSYASRCNAFHMTGLRSDGREMAEAIRCAMDEAQVAPSDIDYVNAHGSGTKQNDRHETAAFKASLGEHAYRVPVSSIKSMVGHSLGAIGSIEIAASILAIENNVVPPTANLTEPDPDCDLDYVPCIAREQRTDVVLSVGSGFGGFQTAMVLAAPERRAA